MTDLLTPEELAEIDRINRKHEAYCVSIMRDDSDRTISHRHRAALLKHIGGMDESTCKWCGITRSGWCKRAETAEADAVLARGMELTERERAEKAEARLQAIGELPDEWRKRNSGDGWVGIKPSSDKKHCANELQALLEKSE